MDQDNNVQAAIEAGQKIAGIADRYDSIDGIPVAAIVTKEGAVSIQVLKDVLAEADARNDVPRRLRGTAIHQELDSFIEHVNRNKDEHSAIFADVGAVKLTAVFNYHRPAPQGQDGSRANSNPARWSDHRAVYVCPLSAEWRLWLSKNETWMSQAAFGQFIEDNLKDLANPAADIENDKDKPEPARVLEVARNLVINATHEFKREINPSTGEGTLHWKKDNQITGTTKVPKSFLIGIPVFEAGDLWRIEARLRYTVDDGVAKFQYALYQPQVTLRDAFGEVRKKAKEGCGLAVFAGSPES